MKYFLFLKNFIFYFFIPVYILFVSCGDLKTVSAKASIDWANSPNKGNSQYKYNSKLGKNVVIGSEHYLFEAPGGTPNEVSSQNADFIPEKIPGGGYLGVAYGLEYITKGAKDPAGGSFGLNYLELPVDALYHYPAGPGGLYGGLGPYFAYGVGGKGGTISSFGENAGGYKRFDAGANFMLGYKLDMGLSLDFSYDLGLANASYAVQDVSSHNRCFSINIGYQIGKLFVKK
jgi:outer membrane protein with beta-barrel domain